MLVNKIEQDDNKRSWFLGALIFFFCGGETFVSHIHKRIYIYYTTRMCIDSQNVGFSMLLKADVACCNVVWKCIICSVCASYILYPRGKHIGTLLEIPYMYTYDYTNVGGTCGGWSMIYVYELCNEYINRMGFSLSVCARGPWYTLMLLHIRKVQLDKTSYIT